MDCEVFEERDRFMFAMLESLGTRNGVAFEPDERQQYRAAYKDGAVQFLDGGKHYSLTLPPESPAKTS